MAVWGSRFKGSASNHLQMIFKLWTQEVGVANAWPDRWLPAVTDDDFGFCGISICCVEDLPCFCRVMVSRCQGHWWFYHNTPPTWRFCAHAKCAARATKKDPRLLSPTGPPPDHLGIPGSNLGEPLENSWKMLGQLEYKKIHKMRLEDVSPSLPTSNGLCWKRWVGGDFSSGNSSNSM